jgi:hypothetical protein
MSEERNLNVTVTVLSCLWFSSAPPGIWRDQTLNFGYDLLGHNTFIHSNYRDLRLVQQITDKGQIQSKPSNTSLVQNLWVVLSQFFCSLWQSPSSLWIGFSTYRISCFILLTLLPSRRATPCSGLIHVQPHHAGEKPHNIFTVDWVACTRGRKIRWFGRQWLPKASG